MPATPRSNQNRRISSCSRMTSGWPQFRSGWPGAKRWRYHCSGVPSGPITRDHAGPPNSDSQPVGAISPSSPSPSRNQKRSRSGEPGPDASAAWNHTWWSDTWLGTTSMMVRMPEGQGVADQALGLVEVPEERVDGAVVGDVVPAVRHRRGVPRREPDRVDRRARQVAAGGPGRRRGRRCRRRSRRRSCGGTPGRSQHRATSRGRRRRAPPAAGVRPRGGVHGCRSVLTRRASASGLWSSSHEVTWPER